MKNIALKLPVISDNEINVKAKYETIDAFQLSCNITNNFLRKY